MGHALHVYDLVWEYMEAQDWPRFMALFHDDVEMIFQDSEFAGLARTEAYFRAVMERFPDIRHKITVVVEDADEQAMAGWVTAEAAGSGDRMLFGQSFNIDGCKLTFEAVDFLHFKDGKIICWRAMLDYERHIRDLDVNVTIVPR